MSESMRTYQARPDLTEDQCCLLDAYACLHGRVERTLFARIQAGEDLNTLKRDFQKRFGITARQFNAAHAELGGNISSIKERQPDLIDDLKGRIKRARQVLKRITNPEVLHHKKRRLAILEQKLTQLQQDKSKGIISLCFGSKKLFRAQFHLKENGYASHEQWLSNWQAARNSQFFVLGSRDETAGCQGCVATVAEDGSISLRLRLPNALSGKYTIIPGLWFAHGHDAIVAAIGRNLSDHSADWQAISYRFVKDDKGWRVFVSISLPKVKYISDRRLGVIGVDINADHLAITGTDRFGNPLDFRTIPCCTYGKSSDQSRAIVSEAVKSLVAIASDRRKPIVIEELDFRKKKAALGKEDRRHARMLSSLAYRLIHTVIAARAYDAGIELLEETPAYTSVIGQEKFAGRYGISGHHAAALVIGRRVNGFSERLPGQLQVTLPLPVRNRGRHVWSTWAVVFRKGKQRMQRTVGRARPDPGCHRPKGMAHPVITPFVAGEIPACESSLIPFE
jgi:IS605 OrfB family transposase